MATVRRAAPDAARRLASGALAACVLAAGACRDQKRSGDEQAPPAPAAEASDSGETSAPAPAVVRTAPLSPEDSIRLAREDSIHESRLFHQRQQSMEGYASCMAKAKLADPQQRPVLEAACNRSRPAAP